MTAGIGDRDTGHGPRTGMRVLAVVALTGSLIGGLSGLAGSALSADPAVPRVASATTATGQASITVTGFVVPGGPSAVCDLAAAVDEVRVGRPVLVCWSATNTGEVRFESHTIVHGLDGDGDANAPSELFETLPPGGSLTWSPPPSTPVEVGAVEFVVTWVAYESDAEVTDVFSGASAQASATARVTVGSAAAAPTVGLPATE